MRCPEVGAKGFQALSCPRKGRKEVSAAQLHHYCPKGNLCKILARKGKSTKCLQVLPATVFFQRKGEGLYFCPCFLICLCNYLYLYTNLISVCLYIYPLRFPAAEAALHFAVPSWEREAAPAAGPGAGAQHTCTPHFPPSTGTFNAWHLRLHGRLLT